jgi:hypothetical protein
MMLLSAATALVHDRGSYLALRRFAFLLNALVTAGMIVLVVPPVFRFVGEGLIGLPPEISRLAHASTAVMIAWPAAIGYRRFYQGILVRHHLTRRVAYGTVVRLGTMSVAAIVLTTVAPLPGATIGTLALVAGVVVEAVASRVMAGHTVGALLRADGAAAQRLSLRAIATFYYPLALTSILSMALGPLITFGLGRGRAPIESLAVWPVVSSLVFVFRSGGVAYQEVAIALAGSHPGSEPVVRRTALWLGSAGVLALGAMAWTPLATVWFERAAGLSPELAAYAIWPMRILALMPALEFWLSVQRAGWILTRRTVIITMSTIVEAVGLVAALMVAVGPLNVVGVVGGAAALLVGRAAANLYLYVRDRRGPAS